MRRLYPSLVGITAVVGCCLTALASNLDFKNRSQLDRSNNIIISQNSQQTERRNWLKKIFTRERQGGTRRGMCLVSPNGTTHYIWLNDSEPLLFVWKGMAERIQIYDANRTLIWDEGLNTQAQNEETFQRVVYKGDAQLEPGKIYSLQLHRKYPDVNPPTRSFSILPETEKVSIKNDIARLLMELENTSSNLTEEDKAWSRIQYFADYAYDGKEGLFLNIVQELFSVSNPSSEWIGYLEDLNTTYCKGNR